jgi:hypothetical protein
MIYGWLWDDDALEKHWDSTRVETDVAEPCDHHPGSCELPFGMQVPHFFILSYVGSATVFEMVETMYEKLPESLTAQEPDRIESVLFQDPFHAGYKPVYKLRELQVECKVDKYRTPPRCDKDRDRYVHGPAAGHSSGSENRKLASIICSLLAIPKRSGFFLNVILEQCNVRLAVLEETLETFREVYDTFVEAGASVEVHWQYTRATGLPRDEVCLNGFFDDKVSHADFNAKMIGAWQDVS